ncbi:hypothetical protein FBQ83_06715 [Chloroflexi bacterium CFX5]|nr:hypothetical protein [Chloroflexi bacterium CFX5]
MTMKKIMFIVFLALMVAACAPFQSTPVDAQNTAMVAVQTYIALTKTALPTLTVIPTATPEATLIPTLPPLPIITPNAVQVEQWREYQNALAKKLVSKFPVEIVLCEWDILGETEKELYVWAVCAAPGYVASKPAVMYFKTDGSIQGVEIAVYGSTWDSDIRRMFPEDVREVINSGFFIQRSVELKNHIEWRRMQSEVPPLIILSVTLSATPTP